ncbi:glycoside hydrolase [Neocallimastix californiae]|uniref:Glycoside hydrolase n=1 Tax=Neocallimastix californiae TaxID=1754190 RepID=A0A1Y2C710_9FUNG|nr:glycoside hydrolase [Neocallimastix californiae]|eukprot:ORY42684.1 glycoside hydrolase [Neocallimastix californiae]
MKAYTVLLLSVALTAKVSAECYTYLYGYSCCKDTSTEILGSDEEGFWGKENGEWCFIPKNQGESTEPTITTQPSSEPTTQNPQEPPNQNPEIYVTVQFKKENASIFNDGRFEGFGTSFCWWANRLGYSDSLAEQSATAFYDKNDGLGLNIIRYNIGGGDNPEHDHITRTDSNMPGYAINPNYDGTQYTWDYDWSSDFNQRNVLLKSLPKNKEEIIVEAFSNSPPYFMTNSGCSTGNIDAWDDNLKDDAYPAFAKYLADVAEHFKTEWNVTFQSITPLNEPYTNYWGAYNYKQEGCHFDQGDSQSNIIVELRKAIDERGLTDMQISGTDESNIDTQINSFKKLSAEAKNAITRIDTHTYSGSKRNELRKLAEEAHKNLWMSEVDGGNMEGTNPGEMGAALWLANRIIFDLSELRASAWVLWQVIDNHISKEGYNVADHDNDRIILTQKYYGYGQFTRYIRPGYTIIASNNNAIAAYDREGKKLVIVTANNYGSDVTVDFDLSDFSSVGSEIKVIRTSGSLTEGEQWAELSPLTTYGTGFKAEVKANSITTYIIEEVEW